MTTRSLVYIMIAAMTIFIHDVFDLGDGLYIITAISFGLALRCLYLAARQETRS